MTELNFPLNPQDGDTYLDYVYRSTSNAWLREDDMLLENIGDVSISSPSTGDAIVYSNLINKWINSKTPKVPTGAIIPYTAEVAPEGYMVCGGQTISQTTYSQLYSVIGSSYNVGGEPSGTFRLPNLTSRVPLGYNSSDSDFNQLGKSGGRTDHVLTISELPSHTHIQNPHTHSQNSHNHGQDSHSHSATTSFYTIGGSWGLGYFGSFRGRVGITGGWGLGTSWSQPGINANTATNQSTTAQNLSTGGSKAHNNMQPYIIMNYIIKL